jgi:hypothetical protein
MMGQTLAEQISIDTPRRRNRARAFGLPKARPVARLSPSQGGLTREAAGLGNVPVPASIPNGMEPRRKAFPARIRGLFSNDLSIDLGTANTLIYARDQGIVLNEPSVVAIRQDRGPGGRKSSAAVGEEAKKMLGRTPAEHHRDPPDEGRRDRRLHRDREDAAVLHHKVHESRLIRPSPRVLVCVPCGSTQVERRAIKESAAGAGAREVYLIEEPMAAAIGAGCRWTRPAARWCSTSAAAPPRWR